MTLHVAIYAAVLLLFVSVCPTARECRGKRGWIASISRCFARLFERKTITDRQTD